MKDNKGNYALANRWGDGQRRKAGDTECGMGSCRPDSLQCCATMGCFTAVYGLSGLVTSSLQIYINSQITTLEKQFGLTSAVSGLILSSNDIGYLLTTLFMSYIARRTHIPRMLALSTMFFGFSGLICTIPHFMDMESFALSAKDGNATTLLDSPIRGGELCANASHKLNETLRCGLGQEVTTRNYATRTAAILFLAIGMCLQGFGKSPRYPFLATYVDDNVEQTKTPMYLGIISSVGIFGPALGFTLGGVFSKIYVTLEDTDMSLRDPRWIGAWWLGFLFFGSLGVIAGIPLVFFPKKMKSRPQHIDQLKRKKTSEMATNRCSDLKGLIQSVGRLLINPIYICCCMAMCVTLFSVSGMLAFLPKYLESQYLIPTWKANILLGTVNVFGAASGALIGGLVASKLKLTPLACLKLNTTICFLSAFVVASGFLLGCPSPTINKSSASNQNQTDGMLVLQVDKRTNTTNGGGITCEISKCDCDDDRYFPVCGSDKRNYFSPCHAGCSHNENMIYTNCSCIEGDSATAEPGLCASDCNNLYPYVALNFLGAIVTTTIAMPNFVIAVRSMKESDKPLGIGMSAFLSTLLGWFPGPVVYGKIIDTTCLLWSSTCSGRGACSHYDVDAFRVKYHTLFATTKALAFVFYVIALVVALKKTKPFFVDETADPKETEMMLMKKRDVLDTKGTKV